MAVPVGGPGRSDRVDPARRWLGYRLEVDPDGHPPDEAVAHRVGPALEEVGDQVAERPQFAVAEVDGDAAVFPDGQGARDGQRLAVLGPPAVPGHAGADRA